MITARHNGYGVDITGTPANVDAAMAALNAPRLPADTVGASLNLESYFVFYGDHESGAAPGFLLRPSLDDAYKSERLMGQCGYRFTEVRHAMSIGEIDR